MRAIAPQDQEEFMDGFEIPSPQTGDSVSRGVDRRVILWSWIAIALFGLAQAMAARFYMNPDGISYADLADAYIRGDWNSAISAYWSPLYPFLLSVVFRVVHPSPYSEAIAIHLLNFFLYLGCFASLQVFIFQITAFRPSRRADDFVRFSRPALLVFGAILFLTATEYYLPLSMVTPDLCVVAVTLLCSTIVVRLERLGVSSGRLIGLGLMLGVGYLAKAAFFPVAFVFMAIALARKADLRTFTVRTGIMLGAFLIIAGPNIVAISKIEHSITFADTGKLNYLWYVNGMSKIHFELSGNTQGLPTHPSRKIFENPNVYEFATPIQATYPVWFNPSYWNEGVSPNFNPVQQFNAIALTSYVYKGMFSRSSAFCFAWLLVAILQYQSGLSLRSFLEHWRILVPSVAALLVYLPVYVEMRHVSAFIIVILIAMYSSIRLPSGHISKHVLTAALIVLAVTTLIGLYPSFHTNMQLAFQPLPNPQWEVAQALHRDFGLQNGDSVGCIGNCFFSYWARLGKLRIVTEIPNRQAQTFQGSSAAIQLAALQSMATAGAKLIVTTSNFGKGWQPVGHTDYFVYDLRSRATADPIK